MTTKERNRIKTDQAWNKLHTRLDQEGLLDNAKPCHILHPALRKWGIAASVAAILCLVLYTTLLRNEGSSAKGPSLLTRQNTEVTTSLVTTLEDGSIVYLTENTSLQYPEHFSTDKREVSLSGNALFDITGNRARPFLIETESVQVEVLGTSFNVKSNEKSPFELSVKRGEVKVTSKKSGENIHVKAGETVFLHSDKLHKEQTRDAEVFNRYTERIRFKDEKLGNILRVLNLQSPDIQIRTTPELENRLLTVTFYNNTPETMSELICRVLHLKHTQNGNMITLSE